MKEEQRRITQYDGLYGERHARTGTEYLFSELLETRSHQFGWDIRPHLHPQLYQLFFIPQGPFDFITSSDRRQLEGPCLVFIPPAALHGFSYQPGATGRILTLSDTLVDTLFPGEELLAPMLPQTFCLTVFTDRYPPQRLQGLLEAVDEELFQNGAGKPLLLRACLQQLFLVLYRLWRHLPDTVPATRGPETAALGYFRKFQQRLRQAGATDTIAQMAAGLGISPVHLNRVCRAVTGQPAGRLLQEHLLEEARKYLTHTAYSVSEIAYLLQFEYPNYFARFFRKHTGLSPSRFRQKEEEK
ncbi:helix-turn-helix domain-containing protein [Paraflavisolibacter sp. H34]|uniref:helix-turn-helix domain-containing protein n=1 Tax=Huijunlia imazamoxiresistens TaxID=3127457 RepID=UPI0030172A70